MIFTIQDYSLTDDEVIENYESSPAVEEIVESAGLSIKGQAMLYRGSPKIVSQDILEEKCKKTRELLALGCKTSYFAPDGPLGLPVAKDWIFIKRIDDDKYTDEIIGTGVHEMLHLAYSRLSSGEKERVNGLIDQSLVMNSADPYLYFFFNDFENVDYDETHAVLGQRFRNLSPELEEYYSNYFDDREKILHVSENSNITFLIKDLMETLENNDKDGQFETILEEFEIIFPQIREIL